MRTGGFYHLNHHFAHFSFPFSPLYLIIYREERKKIFHYFREKRKKYFAEM